MRCGKKYINRSRVGQGTLSIGEVGQLKYF